MTIVRSVNLSVGAVQSELDPVQEAFFGGNFLFGRDRVGADGTYDEKADALSIDFIRYPGGTVAEESFLLTNPNRTGDPANGNPSLFPLSSFISFVEEDGHDYSLVTPTIRYMKALEAGEITPAEIRAEIRTFSQKLKAGEYGDKLPSVIEIGNEYYDTDIEGGTAAELYGRVAKMFSQEIKKVFGNEVKIAVQSGVDQASNEIILDFFQNEKYLVDQVIFHSYPWTIDQVWRFETLKMDLADAWLDAGVAEGVFVSEFNISNQRRDGNGELIGPDRQEFGMAKAVALVEMAAGLIEIGVESASVWPLQQNTNGDLGGDEGELASNDRKLSDNNLTLSGEAFRLLSESAVGKTLVASRRLDFDGAAEAERYEKEAFIRVFENRDETTIFLSGWDLQSDQIGAVIDLNVSGRFFGGEIVRLYAGGDSTSANAPPVIETEALSAGEAGDLEVALEHDYEIVRITLKKIGQYAAGTAGSDQMVGAGKNDLFEGEGGDDDLNGMKGVDTLDGGAGNDVLTGGDGNDRLIGGLGDDALFGGRGHDDIDGGAGADSMTGGLGGDTMMAGDGGDFVDGEAGRDLIHGNAGDDTLLGGGDNDTLFGGNGDDRLSGEAGADRLAAADGHDTLFGGDGADTLLGRNGRDELHGEAGEDRLFTGKGNDLAFGGTGDDELISYFGHDTLTGGDGSDTFHFAARGGARTITVEDFERGVDRLLFEGAAPTEADISIQSGADTIVFAGNVRVVLKDVADIDLSEIGLVRTEHALLRYDERLETGVQSDAIIGNGYMGATDGDAVAKVGFENVGRDLEFSFRSFDIDAANEVDLFLNGKLLGALDDFGNNQSGVQTFQIAAADMLAGTNDLYFVQNLGASEIWGVEDMLIT